jgi:hypothetical protein
MATRLTRVAARVAGLGPIARSGGGAGSLPNRGFANRRGASTPQSAYTGRQQTVITGGYAAAVVPASGSVTVRVGPMGTGTVWYPQAAAISTTTGASDASTCALYLTPLENGSQVPATQIGGQSYAGGGDTIGLAVPPMWPGYFIVAVWTGATPGDLAALAVYGTQQVLTA